MANTRLTLFSPAWNHAKAPPSTPVTHLPNKATQCHALLNNKGNFPLAEWNKIIGKCFSYTPLGPGDGLSSCDI